MSSLTESMTSTGRHSRATRVFHAALALAIVSQLLTSLAMRGPNETRAGDLLFQVHRYSGLLATALALCLWVVIFVRRRGTDVGALLPWASRTRRAALWADTKTHFSALTRLQLPPYDEHAALPSAIHGLGLLLMTAMAVSGTIYFIEVATGMHSAAPNGMLVMDIHFLFGNLVWAYLIGHASLAALHHILGMSSLTEMWSFRK